MKTIAQLKNEATIQNVCFSEISKETTDFTYFEFLNNPFCSLIYTEEHIGGMAYYVIFNCPDASQRISLNNGIWKVKTEEDYIYDARMVKPNQIITNA